MSTNAKPRGNRRQRATTATSADYQSLDFRKKNWILFAAGLVAIGAGFASLSTGDITLAPILLVGGYLGLIPWAILTRTPNGADSGGE